MKILIGRGTGTRRGSCRASARSRHSLRAWKPARSGVARRLPADAADPAAILPLLVANAWTSHGWSGGPRQRGGGCVCSGGLAIVGSAAARLSRRCSPRTWPGMAFRPPGSASASQPGAPAPEFGFPLVIRPTVSRKGVVIADDRPAADEAIARRWWIIDSASGDRVVPRSSSRAPRRPLSCWPTAIRSCSIVGSGPQTHLRRRPGTRAVWGVCSEPAHDPGSSAA